jgi:hypothetical protein
MPRISWVLLEKTRQAQQEYADAHKQYTAHAEAYRKAVESFGPDPTPTQAEALQARHEQLRVEHESLTRMYDQTLELRRQLAAARDGVEPAGREVKRVGLEQARDHYKRVLQRIASCPIYFDYARQEHIASPAPIEWAEQALQVSADRDETQSATADAGRDGLKQEYNHYRRVLQRIASCPVYFDYARQEHIASPAPIEWAREALQQGHSLR